MKKQELQALRKPFAICQYDVTLETVTDTAGINDFIQKNKHNIETIVSGLGLELRIAKPHDLHEINKLTHRQFSPEAAKGISLYELYRTIEFGYPVVIVNENNEVLGYDLSIGYDDSLCTSYEIAIAVAAQLNGYRLGALVSTYGSLLGLERGSSIRRSSVHPANLRSVKNLLNHTGFVVADFNPNFLDYQGPKLILALPLTPAGILNNRIDDQKLKQFIETHNEGEDYVLIKYDDYNAIGQCYTDLKKRIMALYVYDNQTYYFAV